tara:strand:+ start:463 stop:1524 length:1062 start_codon:yes stop_codon:yes gene_type:complete
MSEDESPTNTEAQLKNMLSAFNAFGKPAEGDTGIEVLRNAGMDFDVELQPIYYSKSGGAVADNSKFRRVARTDTNATLGVVSKSFVPFQPKEMAAIGEQISGTKDVKWDRVGTTHGGARMMMSFQLPEEYTFGNGDATEKVQTFFYIMNAHDGSSGLKIVPSPVRLACSNQFPMLDGFLRRMGINPKHLSLRHSSLMHGKMSDVIKALNIVQNVSEAFTEMTEDMLQVNMDIGARVEYYIDVLGLTQDKELVDIKDNPYGLKTRGLNTLNDLIETEELPRNNIGDMNDTAFQAWTTITDFLDHRKIYNKDGTISEAKVESSIMGSSAKLKNHAFDKLDTRIEEAKAEALVATA